MPAPVIDLLGVVYLLLYLFLVALFARVVMELVLQYARRWTPGRRSAATLECVWSVTDPPLRALRRVIPPLRIGSVSLDLAFLVLLVLVYVLMNVVVGRLL